MKKNYLFEEKNYLFLRALKSGEILVEYTLKDKGHTLSITRTNRQGFDPEYLDTIAGHVKNGFTNILSFKTLKTLKEELK